MFTLDQITRIHDRLGDAATLPDYVRTLKSIGVERYTSYVSDGHSEYVGTDGSMLASPAVHEKLAIAKASNRDQFLEHLRRHGERKTTYLEMSKGLADSGVEKWTVDTTAMTMAYYDTAGTALLIEAIS